MRIRVFFLAIFLIVISASPSISGLLNQNAPEFTLQDFSGKSVSLKDFKGRVVFIDFWASWCPPCKKEFPEINGFAEKYSPSDAAFIVINIDKRRSHADDFLSSVPNLSKNLVVLFDSGSAVVRNYNVAAMPTSFIIDKSGVVRYIHFGFKESDPKSWADEIDKLLKEK